MNNYRIISPMPSGNGAYIAHCLLDAHLPEYHVASYHPRWTYFPLVLPIFASTSKANLIHTTPDYALFFHRKSTPMVITFQNYVLDHWMRKYSTGLQKVHYATDLRLWTKKALKKCLFIRWVAGAGLDTPFKVLTRDLRVIPCRTGRYGVSSSLVDAILAGKTSLISEPDGLQFNKVFRFWINPEQFLPLHL